MNTNTTTPEQAAELREKLSALRDSALRARIIGDMEEERLMLRQAASIKRWMKAVNA